MYVRKLVAGAAFGILTMASAATSADAADWQALHGAAATPMTSAQMDAVQGKALVRAPIVVRSGGTTPVVPFNGKPCIKIDTSSGPVYFMATNGGSIGPGFTFIVKK